jgi:hypothetical protein
MIELIQIAFIGACIAWFYCTILLDEGMLLHFVWEWLYALPNWLSKPLGMCIDCTSGQFGLWLYLIMNEEYSFINHIFVIALTVVMAKTIDQWVNR